ncbi:unnamed protein product [Sphagnum tenellum]
MLLPRTPSSESEFTKEWILHVLQDSLSQDDGPIEVISFEARKNEVQGILSTTFVVDIQLRVGDSNLKKSIFVKVPLKDEPAYRNVNIREATMLREVLPQLQSFLDEKCDGFFRLPMPKLVYCHYDGSGESDVFVLENLLEEGFYNFNGERCLNEPHMKAVLDCLAYLHGTGLAYKRHSGGLEGLQREFPQLDVQIQLHDLIDEAAMRRHFGRNFRAFLHYMEEAEPALARHTGYMKRMHRHILKVVESLEGCGYQSLITLAHGDAKPNNFMFRRIEIDLEECECEGIDPMLIDWQGGFLGSAANDLMWALYPFVESDRRLYPVALEYYFDMLKTVLGTFKCSYAELGIPDDFGGFASLLKRCLVLEFLTVTVIKPVMSLEKPERLWTWHKQTLRNRRRRFKRTVVKPEMEEVFSSPRFTGFCLLYFRIATSLGAFQELGSIYFDIMKDSVFDRKKTLDEHDSDEEEDEDLVSRVINAPLRVLAKALAGSVVVVAVVAGLYQAWSGKEAHQLVLFRGWW